MCHLAIQKLSFLAEGRVNEMSFGAAIGGDQELFQMSDLEPLWLCGKVETVWNHSFSIQCLVCFCL